MSKLAPMLGCLLLTTTSQARPALQSPPTSSLLNYSVGQWKAAPEMRIADAYKWLFQATLGGEHAVQDESEARAWLDDEWKNLAAPTPGEPRSVPLTPDGKLVRINLRPFKAAGEQKQRILDLFVASARQFHADKSAFIKAWRSLGRRLRRGAIGHMGHSDWLRFDKAMKKASYPACEHSPEYERAYHPAYRVVLGALWKRHP